MQVRPSIAIQVLLALGPAAFWAPFLHLHRHENTVHFAKAHRAQTLVTHTHFPTCRSGDWPDRTLATSAAGEDADAIFLNWFQAKPHPAPGLDFVPAETTIVPAPEQTAAWIGVPVHRSHDPPLILSFSPRSPPIQPAFLGV